jgi:hypothetical protein
MKDINAELRCVTFDQNYGNPATHQLGESINYAHPLCHENPTSFAVSYIFRDELVNTQVSDIFSSHVRKLARLRKQANNETLLSNKMEPKLSKKFRKQSKLADRSYGKGLST